MGSLAVFTPYTQFAPPTNGGTNRAYFLLKYLSSYFDIISFSHQNNISIDQRALLPNIRFISCPFPKKYKNKFSKIFSAINYKYTFQTLNPSSSSDIAFYKELSANEWLRQIDVAIFTTTANIELARWIKKHFPNVTLILNTENVESDFWGQLYENTKYQEYQKKANFYKRLEASIGKIFDGWVACSKDDHTKLNSFPENTKIHSAIVPNGVEIDLKKFILNRSFESRNNPNIIFCGDLTYYPNKQAVLWFIDNVWVKLKLLKPNAKFQVIGRINEIDGLDKKLLQKDVEVRGFVKDLAPYYYENSISIVPIFSGSGTRLKILDAFGYGTPVVSTILGAMGLVAYDQEHLLLAETSDEFLNAIMKLCTDRVLFTKIQEQARELVEENYTWQLATVSFVELIRKCKK